MKNSLLISVLAAILVSCSTTETQTINVVPYPNEVSLKSGIFDVRGADFHYDERFDEATQNIVKGFAEQLALVTETTSDVSTGKSGDGFVFILDPKMEKEAYCLNINRNSVKVKASSLSGVNYAIQTIKQMLPVQIYGKDAATNAEWTLQCAKINDKPRFGYRGLHMDVSRHFFDIDVVKKHLDLMEIHKLNTLHWHLTDDQGWRLEIKQYPRLTEVGSIRKETLIGHAYGTGVFDGTPYGEGFWYTQEQVREIIEYAAAKGITIIPEIDLPGHMLAALAAYPEYGCTGGPYDVWGMWGIADDVLCAGNEQAMVFLENILAEVADLFPSEYIHIGGDECPKVRWEKCPKCQAKIKELGLEGDEEFQAEHYLQSYVMARMTEFLGNKGKKIIGWDEILEGEVAENATIMSWRGVNGGIKAAQMGHDVIMTPNTFYYLDYYQSLDKENEPLAIGGYVPIEKCYSYEPFVEWMTAEQRAHILGVQANLWTEYIATADHLYYMLLPRMAALSEVQWCEAENKDWNRFVDSADDFCGIYDFLGYNYATHIFDTKGDVKVNPEKSCVEVHLKAQGGAPVRYTLDGTEPDENSPLYEAPVEIRQDCTLKAVSSRNGEATRVYQKKFVYHKAMGREIVNLTETHPNYTYSCPDMLTDGLRGSGPYNSGEYAGWYNQPMEVVINMGDIPFSNVTLATLVFRYDYIFGPTYLSVLTSEDGENFTELARKDYPIVGKASDGNGNIEFSLDFPETTAKYLKVVAGCLEALPEWHSGAGRPGFVFVDEIIVK